MIFKVPSNVNHSMILWSPAARQDLGTAGQAFRQEAGIEDLSAFLRSAFFLAVSQCCCIGTMRGVASYSEISHADAYSSAGPQGNMSRSASLLNNSKGCYWTELLLCLFGYTSFSLWTEWTTSAETPIPTNYVICMGHVTVLWVPLPQSSPWRFDWGLMKIKSHKKYVIYECFWWLHSGKYPEKHHQLRHICRYSKYG